MPRWPIKDSKGLSIDRVQLARTFRPWGELAAHRVPIHFGGNGLLQAHSPGSSPYVVRRHLERARRSALRNFRGPFGVPDTQRAGTKFEDWLGHQLDRPLLALLQKKMKE